jgi:CheY-like chemotaxis protein
MRSRSARFTRQDDTKSSTKTAGLDHHAEHSAFA